MSQLAELGRKVEAFYRDARDVEWAYVNGSFALLQARPITVAGAAEREQVRREAIAELKASADPRGTVWVRYNLSEVLPRPTPMTWAVIQRLLAADGGFGAMNRDLGAAPDPALGSLSGFDLVAGRPMANLSRLPRMQFANPPFDYPFKEYKRDPRQALDLKPTLNPLAGKGCFLGVLTLPGTIWKLSRLMNTTRKQSAAFAAKFETQVVPPFVAAAKAALAQDWERLDPPAIVREFETWMNRTLVEFARESLKPTVFADLAWNELFDSLKPKVKEKHAGNTKTVPKTTEEQTREVVGRLSLGAAPAADADLARGIRDLESGAITRRLSGEVRPSRYERDGTRATTLVRRPGESRQARSRYFEQRTSRQGGSRPGARYR